MTTNTTRLLRELDAELEAAGLRGYFLVRDLTTGDEAGIDPDVDVPLASLVKVPLALTVLDLVDRGELDECSVLDLQPGRSEAAGPVGVTKFRHPARIALADVVYLSTSLSDTAAADVLFDLVPPETVTEYLKSIGIDSLHVRHPLAALGKTPAEALVRTPELAHTLAATAGTPGGGHGIWQLDTARANVGTARACADLLALVWNEPSPIAAPVARRVRHLMRDNVMGQRLRPDFASDAATWSSKTGTLLNLRHEMGVVEHEGGGTYAIVALTASRVPAAVQPAAEATMGRVARKLRDHVRG